MSQRSATNPRNTDRDNQITGVARKSASSAKPAKAAASSVRMAPSTSKEKREEYEKGENLEGLTKEEKKARKKERRRKEDRIYAVSEALMEADPDYQRYHRIWWAILIVGICGLVALWIYASFSADSDSSTIDSVFEIVCLVIAYGSIIGALIFDMVKVRPIRNQYQTIAEGMSENKLNSVLEKAAADEDRKEREKEAEKAAKQAAKQAKKDQKKAAKGK